MTHPSDYPGPTGNGPLGVHRSPTAHSALSAPRVQRCEINPTWWRIFAHPVWLCASLVGLLSSAAPVGAQFTTPATQADPTDAVIGDWVIQLGDAEFRVRQRATSELVRVGRAAVPQLERARQAPDPEVRVRAEFILRSIHENVRQRIVDDFLAGNEVVDADILPGWRRWTDLVGQIEGHRALYAVMLQQEWAFLEQVDRQGQAEVIAAFNRRIWDLYQDQRNRKMIPVGSFGCLLLVATRDDVPLSNPTGILSLCYSPDFDRAMHTDEYRATLHELLNRMIAKVGDAELLAQRFHFVLHYDLPAGLEPARQVLTARQGTPHVRQYAILVLAKMGTEDDLKLIEQQLDDATIVAQGLRMDEKQFTTEVRDVALAVLVRRLGVNPAEYGLTGLRGDNTLYVHPTSVGFAKAADREGAIERWRNR